MGSGGTGGRVYYRRSDLEAFITRHLFRNTAQADVIPAKAAVIPAPWRHSRASGRHPRESGDPAVVRPVRDAHAGRAVLPLPLGEGGVRVQTVAAAGRTRSDPSIPHPSTATSSAMIGKSAAASAPTSSPASPSPTSTTPASTFPASREPRRALHLLPSPLGAPRQRHVVVYEYVSGVGLGTGRSGDQAVRDRLIKLHALNFNCDCH